VLISLAATVLNWSK